MLPEIGEAGQRKLNQSSVLIAGAGGLDLVASLYLAEAGVIRIRLADADTVEYSNLHRQILFTSADLNKPKAKSGRDRLLAQSPHILVDAINTRLDSSTAPGLVKGYDVILDCSDNYPTRYLLYDLYVHYQKPDVYGAVFHFEGQVSVFGARTGPCYRCFPNYSTDQYRSWQAILRNFWHGAGSHRECDESGSFETVDRDWKFPFRPFTGI